MNVVLESAPGAQELKRLETRGRALILTLFWIGSAIVLFLVSRGKWSDAIIDSGREWIVPDALARGELLYRDVVYWFGPFTPYFHAAFFRFFGSSFRTLVFAGVVGSLGVVAALYVAFRRATGRAEAALWIALAVPALVFMPNAGGSILGMGFRMWHAAAFGLLAIAYAVRPGARHSLRSALTVGSLCALAGLCRTEWGLAILGACVLAVGVQRNFRAGFAREAALVAAAALSVFGGVMALFIAASTPAAVLSDAPVLLIGVPELTRRNVLVAGLRDWPGGLGPLLYSSATWIGAFLVIEFAALRGYARDRLRRRVPWFFAIAVVLLLTASTGGASGASLWSAAPAACAAGLVVGIRRRPRPDAAALAGYGLAGLLLSHRRLFFMTDAPYVGPPLLFAFCCAAALLRLVVVSEKKQLFRHRLRSGILAGIAVVATAAFAGRVLRYASDDRVPVPGTDGMLSAQPELSREIANLAAAVRRNTRQGEGLVVFPEGEVLNFLTDRPNPLPHKLYLPGYLTVRNEEEILSELKRARPAAVVIWKRPTGEYGPARFGEDYGRPISRWIEENYVAQPHGTFVLPQAILAIRR
ncbi:MAG TPA: hypothetical protein VGK70_11690 [Thermoanaerobaculia bacterium]